MPNHAVVTRRATESRQGIYVALEDLDFIWDTRDVTAVIHMWDEGLSVVDMARALDRDADEVALLIMDLARNGRISRRRGGWKGNRKEISDRGSDEQWKILA